MGVWGTGLYQNDLAQDVKDYYKEQLRKGKKGTDITQELINIYQTEISDLDSRSVFWFALADTQWDLGRLESEVKENALDCIAGGYDLKLWMFENPKGYKSRERIIEKLHQKLLTAQPPEKKVAQHRLYKCKWNIGDVFAYQLESDLAKEKGLYGRYFLIQKVDEGTWHPGHVVPIVYVKITSDTKLPSNVEEYNKLEYIQTWCTKYEERFLPIDMSRPQEDIAEKSKIKYQVDEYGLLPQYRTKLLNTSKRVIPAKLLYIGDFSDAIRPQKEFVPHSKENVVAVSWVQFDETFETKMIKRYCGYNLREYDIYRDQSAGKTGKTEDGPKPLKK